DQRLRHHLSTSDLRTDPGRGHTRAAQRDTGQRPPARSRVRAAHRGSADGDPRLLVGGHRASARGGGDLTRSVGRRHLGPLVLSPWPCEISPRRATSKGARQMEIARPTHRAAGAFALLTLLLTAHRAGAVDARIVNGVPTQQRPTTAVLLVRNAAFTTFFGICSATLIGCQHVVTARHCVCNASDFATCITPTPPHPAHLAIYLPQAALPPRSATALTPAH